MLYGPVMLGTMLRERRKQKGHTQAEAAEFLGVHPITFSRWECGLRPKADQVFKIADYLGINVEQLRPHVEGAA